MKINHRSSPKQSKTMLHAVFHLMPLLVSDATYTSSVGDGDGGSSGTSNNNGLSLLFDTFVPISSILTVCIVVGFTLPRHEYFGLFWLMWWALAVYISLLSVDYNDGDANNDGNDAGGLFQSSDDRIRGIVVLVGLPIGILVVLLVWWKKETALPSSSIHRRKEWRTRQILPNINPIRGFVLKRVPLWSMIAIHIYRLDGLSIVIPFWNGIVPKFVGYQTIVLDVIIGITAIPLTYMLYFPARRRGTGSKQAKRTRRPLFLKDALWFWNSLGLYDLCSAYVVLILNICRLGGPTITEPPILPTLGKHPLPLLILFQVPLAIAVHVLMLTNMDALMNEQERQLQTSDDLSLTLPTAAIVTNRW